MTVNAVNTVPEKYNSLPFTLASLPMLCTEYKRLGVAL